MFPFTLIHFRIRLENGQASLDECFKAYSSLQLIQNFMNQSVGSAFMFPGILCFFILLSFGLFALICYYHTLDLPAFLFVVAVVYMSFFFTIAAFTLASRVSIHGDLPLSQISKMSLTEEFKLRLKSKTHLRTRVGNYFYVKPYTVLSFFSIVVSNVITFVITFGKKT